MAKTATIKDPLQFAQAFLGDEGLPNDANTRADVTGWEALEGGNWENTAKDNPLNTSEIEPGSVNYDTGQPGEGVQAYTSWDEGLNATVDTLNTTQYGYPQILEDLANSEPWSVFSQALENSDWDAGHYGHDIGANPAGSEPTKDSAGAYAIGSSASSDSGNSANSPSSSDGANPMSGLAGILQGLDALYSPGISGPSWNPSTWLSWIPKDTEGVATMIFVRSMSSLLSVGVILMGVSLLTKGSGGTGGGASNVLQFVNQSANRRQRAEQMAAVSQRHTENLSDKEAARSAGAERQTNLLGDRQAARQHELKLDTRATRRANKRVKHNESMNESHEGRFWEWADIQRGWQDQ